MFCNQCEQTTRSGTEIGCMIEGVCGKTSKTASLQDIVIYGLEGLCVYACTLNDAGEDITEINNLMLYATFSTLTNANFDDESLFEIIKQR
jgi:hydroxylamine reductase